jgi:hypothetical protein
MLGFHFRYSRSGTDTAGSLSAPPLAARFQGGERGGKRRRLWQVNVILDHLGQA